MSSRPLWDHVHLYKWKTLNDSGTRPRTGDRAYHATSFCLFYLIFSSAQRIIPIVMESRPVSFCPGPPTSAPPGRNGNGRGYVLYGRDGMGRNNVPSGLDALKSGDPVITPCILYCEGFSRQICWLQTMRPVIERTDFKPIRSVGCPCNFWRSHSYPS